MTPMTYLTRCRLDHAKALLQTSDDSVTAIALAVGFGDVSPFTRAFHRQVGVSPRSYRHRRAVARHSSSELVKNIPSGPD